MPEEGPIKIRIVQLGKQVFNYEGSAPCTIAEALKAAQVTIDHLRTDIRLNGETAAGSTLLANGDIITVLPPIKGGTDGSVNIG
jgi:hypothetical protein